MILVVAEKPSVGASISHVLGAGQRGAGYNSGNGYVVTWCVGHLVTLAMPGEIDPEWEKWRLDTLPMLPDRFPLEIIKKQPEAIRRRQKAAQRQPDRHRGLCDRCRARGAVDLHARNIAAGCKKPMQRLWISSMTDDAIRDGFRSLTDNAARNRQQDGKRHGWLPCLLPNIL